MKYLKFFLINIIVFGIFFFAISLLFPGTINNSKSITVLANKEKVYQMIKSLSDWKTWNEFSKTNRIEVVLNFASPDSISTTWKKKNGDTLLSSLNLITIGEDSTAVNWVLQKKIKWYQPFNKFATMLTDKEMSRGMEMSLDNLKTLIETVSR